MKFVRGPFASALKWIEVKHKSVDHFEGIEEGVLQKANLKDLIGIRGPKGGGGLSW